MNKHVKEIFLVFAVLLLVGASSAGVKIKPGAVIEVELLNTVHARIDEKTVHVVLKPAKPIVGLDGLLVDVENVRFLGCAQYLREQGRVVIQLEQLIVRKANEQRTVVDLGGWVMDENNQKGIDGTRHDVPVSWLFSNDEINCDVGGSEKMVQKGSLSSKELEFSTIVEILPGRKMSAVISQIKKGS